MRTLYFHAVISDIILVAFSGAAQATTLATTTKALGGFQGSQSYQATVALNTLDAEVEYAVFAPGNFQSFLDENGIVFADSAATEYTYAYQIVDVAAGTSGVTNLSVGMQGNEAAGSSGVDFIGVAVDYGTYPLPPDVDPGPLVEDRVAAASLGAERMAKFRTNTRSQVGVVDSFGRHPQSWHQPRTCPRSNRDERGRRWNAPQRQVLFCQAQQCTIENATRTIRTSDQCTSQTWNGGGRNHSTTNDRNSNPYKGLG